MRLGASDTARRDHSLVEVLPQIVRAPSSHVTHMQQSTTMTSQQQQPPPRNNTSMKREVIDLAGQSPSSSPNRNNPKGPVMKQENGTTNVMQVLIGNNDVSVNKIPTVKAQTSTSSGGTSSSSSQAPQSTRTVEDATQTSETKKRPNHNNNGLKKCNNKKFKFDNVADYMEKKLELIKNVECDIRKIQKSDDTKRKQLENIKSNLQDLKYSYADLDVVKKDNDVLKTDLLAAKAEIAKRDNNILCYKDMIFEMKKDVQKNETQKEYFTNQLNNMQKQLKIAQDKIKALEDEKNQIKNILK